MALISHTRPLYKNLDVACGPTDFYWLGLVERKESPCIFVAILLYTAYPHTSIVCPVSFSGLGQNIWAWQSAVDASWLFAWGYTIIKREEPAYVCECLHTNTATLVRCCSGWGFKIQFLKISNLKFIFGEKEKFVSEIKRNKQERLTQNISSLFVTFLFQDPNTKRFKRVLIHFDTDTQYAHFGGNFLCQARKQHLNKWLKTTENERDL